MWQLFYGYTPMVCCLLGEAPAATGLHSRNAWGRQLPGMCNAKPKRKGVLEIGLLRGTDSASLAIGEAAKPHALCAGDTRRLGRQGICRPEREQGKRRRAGRRLEGTRREMRNR